MKDDTLGANRGAHQIVHVTLRDNIVDLFIFYFDLSKLVFFPFVANIVLVVCTEVGNHSWFMYYVVNDHQFVVKKSDFESASILFVGRLLVTLVIHESMKHTNMHNIIYCAFTNPVKSLKLKSTNLTRRVDLPGKYD